jgi:DNA-binding transcriptional regulator GbsR (MarR family)
MNDSDFEDNKRLLLEYWFLWYRLREEKENYNPAQWRSLNARISESIEQLEILLNSTSEYQEWEDDLVLVLHPID